MTINSLFNHRSIRKYTCQSIAKETVNKIISAGTRGSNTGNMQLYSIVLTTDEKTKEELSPAHFNQPMITSAPLVATICVDVNRMTKWCELSSADKAFNNFESFITGAIDAAIVAQNMTIAAEEEGLGVCYIGTTTYNPEQIIETLDLPKGVFPLITLTIGYPDEQPELTERLPDRAVVHMEKYKDYTPADIKDIHSAKESNPRNKQFTEDNGKDNLAQVFSEVRYPRQSSESFSYKILEVLRKQGMM